MSITKKILEDRFGKDTAVIMLLRVADERGNQGFVYIAIQSSRFKAFQAAYRTGKVTNLEKWGLIIAVGDGEPNEDVRAYMEEEFGYNHDDSINVR